MPLTDPSPRSPSWADLNPQAQPFVPRSLLMHNPNPSRNQLNAQLLASVPVDLNYLKDTMDGLPDFKLAPLSEWDTFSEKPLELLEMRSPAYPPDLQPPPTCIFKDLPALIADCLRPGTQEHEIKPYSRDIIFSRPRWDLGSLLELSERICFEMYNPCTKPADRVFKACDSARYIAVDPHPASSFAFFVEYKRGAKRQHDIAIMAKHLNQNLSAMQSEEHAQYFMWNLRESVLTRFRETWDIGNLKGQAMSLSKPGTSYDVRCALTLCKSIASFFDQKLINHQHITACMNILLRHLMSVEHVEALALLTLGCGSAYWDESPFTSTTRGIGLAANGHHEPPQYTSEFLTTLATGVINVSLHDSKSLVFPPEVWGEGQLMSRLHQIEVAVTNRSDKDSAGNMIF